MAYVSPGGAFTTSFGEAIDHENALRRQAMLDALHTKQVESEIESGQAALAEKRQEHADKIEEQQRKDTISDVGALAVGDVPDADLIARAKKYHVPLRTETTGGPPTAETGAVPATFGTTATDLEQPKVSIRFAGSPKQADEKRKQDRIDQIIAQVPNLDPAGPDFKRMAIEYEMISGKPLPSALFAKGKDSTDSEAVMRQNPKTGTVERLTPQGWLAWTADVPKGAHWMTEPQPKDTSGAKTAHIQSLHEAAVRELDGWTKQTQGEVEVLRKLDPMLNSPTPITDRLVSPEVLKLIVAGQGSGFRMTRAEIDNVTHGRSRWEDLNQAIVQWSTDPTKALVLSDTQRSDLKALVAEEKRRANRIAHQVIDARTEFDEAMMQEDATKLNKARTKLQQQFLSLDEDESGTAGGGNGASGSTDTRTHYDIVNGKLVPRPKGK